MKKWLLSCVIAVGIWAALIGFAVAVFTYPWVWAATFILAVFAMTAWFVRDEIIG